RLAHAEVLRDGNAAGGANRAAHIELAVDHLLDVRAWCADQATHLAAAVLREAAHQLSAGAARAPTLLSLAAPPHQPHPGTRRLPSKPPASLPGNSAVFPTTARPWLPDCRESAARDAVVGSGQVKK